MKKSVKIALLVLMLILLVLFIREVKVYAILNSLYQIGWLGFLSLLAVTGIAYWMATQGWRTCLPAQFKSIAVYRLFLIRHVGEIIALINPTSIVGGETAKMILIEQQYNIPKPAAASSILIARIVLIYTQLICFFAAVAFLLIQGIRFPLLMQQLLWGLTIFLLLVVLVSGYFIRKNAVSRAVALPPHEQSWWVRYGIKLQQVWTQSIRFFTEQPKAIFYSSLYAVLHWVFGGLEFYIILQLLQYNVSIASALMIDLGVVFFKTAGAFVPGQVGIEELGNKMMLASIDITDPEIWITASLLRRGRQICWIVLGILFYIMVRKKITDTKILPDGSIIRES